jgi:uncharacterized membrane protein
MDVAMDDDPFEDWERYPVVEAEERGGYQRLAWYSGTAGIALVILAVAIGLLRRLGRQIIRIASRLKLV